MSAPEDDVRDPSQHPNDALVEDLLAALSRGDGAYLGTFYTADAEYEDPLTGTVKGDRIARMWVSRTSSHPVGVELEEHEAGDTKGRARWVQTTVHPETKRKIRVEVESRFTFQGGKVHRQEDRYSFWRWSRQALGMLGWTVGWTKSVRISMQKAYAGDLEKPSVWGR